MPPKKKAKVITSSTIFDGIVFTLLGSSFKKTDTQAKLKELIEENSGQVLSSISAKVTHLITTPEDTTNATSQKVIQAVDKNIFILNEDFIHDSITASKKEDENKYKLTVTIAKDSEEEKKRY